ncbi:uncharacterized protein [Typha angustifolia]|uniref:uncharacterized protein n=1 Tax=Typha angustifolia TaxID=59011 RepID=UPI003C2D285C
MSTLGATKRPSKRHARDSSRAKMVLNLDLNSPAPVEGREGASTSANIRVNTQRSRSFGRQQGAVPAFNLGLNNSPIDVEAIDDEVEMVFFSRLAPQTRSQPTRSQSVTVVLDEDVEINPRRSGAIIEDPVTTLSLGTHNKRERIPPNKNIINCDLYLDLDEGYSAKKKNSMQPNPEPVKVVPKEPTFTCPVCMNTLVEASSTICGHIFCQSCIKASIQAQKKCPTCRRKLTMNNFHRVYLPTTD